MSIKDNSPTKNKPYWGVSKLKKNGKKELPFFWKRTVFGWGGIKISFRSNFH